MLVSDLLPRNTFLGTSLILHQAGCFLFGIRPPKQLEDQIILEITGIGGRLEPFDLSLSRGVQREACEEISASVELIPCPRTLVVRGFHEIEEITLEGPERPAALVFRRHRTPPHQPWHANYLDTGCIAVFLGDLTGAPQPSPEIPHLIWLKPEQILLTAQQDVSLGDLLQTGADLLSLDDQRPDPRLPTRLTDSQEALALALGEEVCSFYESLIFLSRST